MSNTAIEIGFQVYLTDGGEEFGAVRKVHPNGDLTVYIENAGDHTIPHAAISAVHSQKVIVHGDQLGAELRATIGHAHDKEEPGA